MPKSFQKNPRIDCNIITEVTPAGKKLRVPTPEKPAYYVLQSGYYQNLGEAAPANAKPPPVAQLARAMKDALAAGGYREAAPPEHPPTLIVIFNYGDHSATRGELEDAAEASAALASHQQAAIDRTVLESSLNISEDEAAEMPPPPELPYDESTGRNTAEQLLTLVLSDQRKYRQLIDRAGLVGGAAFAIELGRVLKQEISFRTAGNSSGRMEKVLQAEADRNQIIDTSLGLKTETRMGLSSPLTMQNGPFHLFYQRNEKTMHLVEEAFGSCYFVVASAFDGAALATKGEKRLLWRTKMTVNSDGVAMMDTLPTLIDTAGPFFGREMTETVTVSRRALRNEKIELGTATVVEESTPGSSPKRESVAPRKE